MYPAPFRYHRAASIGEAIRQLSELGEGARPLAGGQSLLVWMKMRFGDFTDLVDIGRIPGLDAITHDAKAAQIGALATHARIARSPLAKLLPIVGDCANGIADNQVRSRGTIGGSLASGDPACDWPVLLTVLDATLHAQGPGGKRDLPVDGFVEDLYVTRLKPGELVTGISFAMPAKGSAGAYVGFKRCAPAYPTVSVGVQLSLQGEQCEDARIAIGAAGLTTIHARAAEAELKGKTLTPANVARAADAAVAECDPVEDQRGSIAFKNSIINALVKRGIEAAKRRCHGETVEVSHEYY
ncbi:MAG: xanthine dehydrogenase family protein subunit M [Gammaproteobacteria bacterium]|nr:xanthine dehydrogenase family protein subunit M [Gammaproteobacteria bacterium]